MIVRRLDASVDVAHVFTTKRHVLDGFLRDAIGVIRRDAALWVSWPKKTSKVSTEVNEDTIRAIALPLGFVDVKVCAVDEVWSALKLVIRKNRRRG
jgi:hypothetical protein